MKNCKQYLLTVLVMLALLFAACEDNTAPEQPTAPAGQETVAESTTERATDAPTEAPTEAPAEPETQPVTSAPTACASPAWSCRRD